MEKWEEPGTSSDVNDIFRDRWLCVGTLGKGTRLTYHTYVCVPCNLHRNLHYLEIALRILRIRKLHTNLEIVQPILRLCSQCKASAKTPFVVKQRKDMVTDLEKHCITM